MLQPAHRPLHGFLCFPFVFLFTSNLSFELGKVLVYQPPSARAEQGPLACSPPLRPSQGQKVLPGPKAQEGHRQWGCPRGCRRWGSHGSMLLTLLQIITLSQTKNHHGVTAVSFESKVHPGSGKGHRCPWDKPFSTGHIQVGAHVSFSQCPICFQGFL